MAFTEEELLHDIAKLKANIAPLERELQLNKDLLHQLYLKETDLVGKMATSNRLPGGIVISDITFATWAPRTPQTVHGYRIGTVTWSGIPVTSKGFQIHDTYEESNAA
jgi:hypothetical protein